MKTRLKTKNCANLNCGKEFTQQKPMQKVCSPRCAAQYAEQQRWKKEKKETRAALKEFNQNNKRISEWIKEAQKAVNAYVRVRDYHEPCISCGKSRAQIEQEQGWKTGGAWDAGHFKTRGAHPELRFNLWNNHKQCKSCNGGSGKFSHKAKTVDSRYEENLRAKIGDEKVDWLQGPHAPKKFTREYCERVKAVFNKKARMRKKRLGLS